MGCEAEASLPILFFFCRASTYANTRRVFAFVPLCVCQSIFFFPLPFYMCVSIAGLVEQ